MEKSQRLIKQHLLDEFKTHLKVELRDYFHVCIVLPSKRIIDVGTTSCYVTARTRAKNISSNNDVETIVTRPYDLYFHGVLFKTLSFENVIERFEANLPF